MGKSAGAIDHLHRAVSLGWAECDTLTGAMLDSLRGDTEFEIIVEEVEKRTKES
jgi:hypothetical protein